MKEKYLSTKTEIKFAVEAMTQCGANCVGCFLTPELRLAQNFWKPEQFDKAKKFIRSAIENLENSGENVDEVALNLGQGDYFQLDEESIRNVVEFIYDCADGKASAFITASGVTNHEKLKQSVDLFYKYSIEKNQALLVDFVLDASKLSSPKMLEVYSKNLSYIRSKFGHVDVNLNINADTVENFTPDSINDFMLRNELKFLVINVVPAYHNKVPLQQSWNKIMKWMYDLYQMWDKENYDLNFADSIKIIQTAYPSEYDIFSSVKQGIQDIMLKGYVIDNNGQVFFQQAGFGDLPLSERNGFAVVTHIDSPYDFGRIKKASQKVCVEIIKEQVKGACANCSYQNLCAANGMFVAKRVLHDSGSQYIAPEPQTCPINLKPLYEAISSDDTKNNVEHCYGGDIGIFAQKGLENCPVKTRDMVYSDKEIHIK